MISKNNDKKGEIPKISIDKKGKVCKIYLTFEP